VHACLTGPVHACLTGPARVCARAEALQLAENLLVADVTAENFGFAAQVPNKRRLKSQSSLVSRPRARPSGINVALKKFAVQFNAVQGPAVTMTVNDVEAECAASLTFAAGQLSCVLASQLGLGGRDPPFRWVLDADIRSEDPSFLVAGSRITVSGRHEQYIGVVAFCLSLSLHFLTHVLLTLGMW
jgi:hypothetical protein